jgi:transcriptional regulator with XRE-family HTH domain
METVGARLKRARLRRVISQADLAERSGVREVTISRIENDRYGPPRLGTIRKLADALRVDAFWLATGEGDSEGKIAA